MKLPPCSGNLGQKALGVGSSMEGAPRRDPRSGGEVFAAAPLLEREAEVGAFPYVVPFLPCWILQRGNFGVYYAFREVREAYRYANSCDCAYWRLRWLHAEFGQGAEVERLPGGIEL